MLATYITHYGTDLSVVNAARVSFDKESEWEFYSDEPLMQVLSDRDQRLVHYLAKAGHTSCFEHQGATLRLKVPIFIARQIQRHRTFSYNEVSRRYVDDEPEFFWPDKWRKRAENVKQGSSDEEVHTIIYTQPESGHTIEYSTEEFFKEAAEVALATYDKALSEGVAPELARMILPQNMYTEFYMTGNLRNWAHFLKLRLDGHAQKEVQDIAVQVRDILTPLFPVSMDALMKETHD